FRPINMRWAPDGSIYLIDWHDQNPCHQAQPDSWDMTHGRIYKIQRKGARNSGPVDLGRKSSQELVDLLRNDNPWWYRTALRLLNERKDTSVIPPLKAILFEGAKETHQLRALWGLHAVGGLDADTASRVLKHASSFFRAWTIRLMCESGQVPEALL